MEGVKLFTVYFIGKLVEKEHDKHPISEFSFIQKKVEDFYCPQAWSTVGLEVWTYIYDRRGCLGFIASIDWQYGKAFLILYIFSLISLPLSNIGSTHDWKMYLRRYVKGILLTT